MSWGTIALVAGAYAVMVLLILTLLVSSKRGEQATREALAREREQRAREEEDERRDVA